MKEAVKNWKGKHKETALKKLGYGLHAIQDISAHGQIGRGNKIPQHIAVSSSHKNWLSHADTVKGYVWQNSSRNGLKSKKGDLTRLFEAQRDTYNYLEKFISSIGGYSKIK